MPSDRIPKHKQRLATKSPEGDNVSNAPAPHKPKQGNAEDQQKKGASPAGAVKRKLESGDKQKRRANPDGTEE